MPPDPPDPPDDLLALLAVAREYLRANDGVRRAVAAAGRALAALAEWSAPAGSPEAAPPAPVPAPAEPAAPPPSDVPPAPRPAGPPPLPAISVRDLPPLTFAPPPPPAPVSHPGSGEVSPQPLPVIAARCRLKAEAGRLVARRLRGSDERDAHADLARRAQQLPDCYLWMLDPWGYSEAAPVWTDLADAFDAGADAAEMLRVWWELPEPGRTRTAGDVLHLAAEAQAVLFAAVAAADRPKPDGDQVHLFVTIREEAARIQVFVHKYLKREDRADPAAGQQVARRVREFVSPLRQSAEAGKNRHKAVGNLRHKARLLRADPAANAGEWPRVVQLLDDLVTGGLPPSNAEVRDMLLPVLDLMPDDLPLPGGAGMVLREIDRYLATRPAAEARAEDEPPTREVAEVRELLAGRRVVLIGGQVRPSRRDALIEAFGLEDLTWITTVDHESVTVFEAPIARPEVAVVLLAIRWSSHSYGEVQDYCDRYGKLLVRLPAGYHPNQVAHQILTQVGNRLRAAG